jgi:SAM-dependent methyltransferase
MTWLSEWLEKYHGGPVQRYKAEMEPFERAVLRAARRQLLADLNGRVLEVGCGLGQNFPFYPMPVEVVALEPFRPFRVEADNQAAQARARIFVGEADAHDCPFADQTFDGYVASLVFCSLAHPERALQEAARTLKAGSKLRLLEHVGADNRTQAFLQRLANPAWQVFDGAGCRLGQDTLGLVRQAGFVIERTTKLHLSGPIGFFFPTIAIYAHKPG